MDGYHGAIMEILNGLEYINNNPVITIFFLKNQLKQKGHEVCIKKNSGVINKPIVKRNN